MVPLVGPPDDAPFPGGCQRPQGSPSAGGNRWGHLSLTERRNGLWRPRAGAKAKGRMKQIVLRAYQLARSGTWKHIGADLLRLVGGAVTRGFIAAISVAVLVMLIG